MRPKGRYWVRVSIAPGTGTMMKLSVEQRFWNKVDVSAGPNACWLWTGARDTHGYGNFALARGRVRKAHRIAFELTHGDPEGLLCLHSCDNPPCCNPTHIFVGDMQMNMDDMKSKSRQCQGEKKPGSRLTEREVKLLRLIPARVSNREIARITGLGSTTISYARKRKTWTHVS